MSVRGRTGGSGGSALAVGGAPNVGQVLTAVVATGVTPSTYQWTRDGVDIAGATGSTYTVLAGDLGKAIACRISASVAAASVTVVVPEPTGNTPPGQAYLGTLALYLGTDSIALA